MEATSSIHRSCGCVRHRNSKILLLAFDCFGSFCLFVVCWTLNVIRNVTTSIATVIKEGRAVEWETGRKAAHIELIIQGKAGRRSEGRRSNLRPPETEQSSVLVMPKRSLVITFVLSVRGLPPSHWSTWSESVTGPR